MDSISSFILLAARLMGKPLPTRNHRKEKQNQRGSLIELYSNEAFDILFTISTGTKKTADELFCVCLFHAHCINTFYWQSFALGDRFEESHILRYLWVVMQKSHWFMENQTFLLLLLYKLEYFDVHTHTKMQITDLLVLSFLLLKMLCSPGTSACACALSASFDSLSGGAIGRSIAGTIGTFFGKQILTNQPNK